MRSALLQAAHLVAGHTVWRWALADIFMPTHPAPRRDVAARGRVVRNDLDDVTQTDLADVTREGDDG